MEKEAQLYLIFKIIIILIGGLCVFLGYKLFIKGITSASGNFEAKNKLGRVKLINAAPGTFLFILGTVIICYSIFNSKFALKHSSSNTSPTNTSATENDSLNMMAKDTVQYIRTDTAK
jgi:hypothetical protein